jgi:Phytanoyl-CoA dioxygenase (PhyH)
VTENLKLIEDGAVRLERAALDILPAIEDALFGIPADKAGFRIYGNAKLAEILNGKQITQYVGADYKPVRAIFFDKSPETNWALGWHQDRTIAVQEQAYAEGFGPWSVKADIPHVEPPFDLIGQMRTIRIHLDDVPDDNAPLLIARGSHRLGKVSDQEVKSVAEQIGAVTCTAIRGDIWLYATAIIHASSASSGRSHRRVLQVDFANFELPGALRWKGIG